jgi:hypothetical protein
MLSSVEKGENKTNLNLCLICARLLAAVRYNYIDPLENWNLFVKYLKIGMAWARRLSGTVDYSQRVRIV